MLARVTTFAIDGVEPRRVAVEVDIRVGLPAFTIVGLGDTAVRESRERIRAAILNSGFEFPQRRITANLAPASMRKAGPGFDAALALGILAASGQLPVGILADLAVFGELSLSGELRDSAGALVVAEGARRHQLGTLLVSRGCGPEAALVHGLQVAAVGTLREAVEVIAGRRPIRRPAPSSPQRSAAGPDLRDVRGHPAAISALEIAAAGAHNLLLEGPPGSGKTMLARRLPSILPPMSSTEALEVTRIHSITGTGGGNLAQSRPFRAPHHSISSAGLVGGGSSPRPGEATLAHLGVLFLDELSEFARSTLEALRLPLEDGHVTIVRGQRAIDLPTRFMLVAATNPCPCGYAGVGDRCRCADADLRRYQRRLSGPLLDRLDLLVPVGRPSEQEMAAGPTVESSVVRERVRVARGRALARLEGTGARSNGEMDAAAVNQTVKLEPAAELTLADIYRRGVLSARGRHRVLRVARTVADLADHDRVTRDDVLVAIGFRQRVGEEQLAA